MRYAVIARRTTTTNDALTAVAPPCPSWEPMTPEQALEVLEAGDVALGRLDVLPTIDGMEDGLWALGALAARGVTVLNAPAALLATHDKLLTARILVRDGVDHPRTRHVRDERPRPVVDHAVVLKPRFGSWGREVSLCDDDSSLDAALRRIRHTSWFRRHGALVQELVPPQGYDLRVLVAAGRVVGSIFRIAAEGDWRTNVALGAVRRPVFDPPQDAVALAVRAARATGADLVGVDLLPDGFGGWTVVELNGAVEFTREYSPWSDVFADVASLLADSAVDRKRHAIRQVTASA